VTNKTEHESGAPAAPDENENADARAVPSIIVDPALAALMSEAAAQPDPIRGSGQGNGGTAQAGAVQAPAATAPEPSGDQNELSAEDAERFAASIRPSWQPPEGKDYGNGAAAAVVASTPVTPGTAAMARLAPAEEDAIKGLPGSERKRGLMITTAAVLGFFALAALGIATSRPDVPAASEPSAAAPKTVVAPPKLSPRTRKAAPAAPAVPAPVPTTAPGASAAVPAPPSASPASAGAAAAAPTAAIALPPAAPAQAPPVPTPIGTPPPPTGTQPMPPSAAVTLPSPQSVTSAQTRVAPAREKPVEPATVHIQILARPKHARLTLDGSPIPNPFEADVVKGGKHRVQAHADGHRSNDLTISFDRDRDLELKLDAIGAAGRPKKARNRTRASAQQANPAPKPAKAAAETAPARGAGFVSESPY